MATTRNDTSGRLTTARTMRGSTVFNIALEELGRIDDVIIEEPAGRIAFAILQQGGFLGIGGHHYPLRWETLRFDVEMGGYIADVDPSYTNQATETQTFPLDPVPSEVRNTEQVAGIAPSPQEQQANDHELESVYHSPMRSPRPVAVNRAPK
jgi:hypothetical protein